MAVLRSRREKRTEPNKRSGNKSGLDPCSMSRVEQSRAGQGRVIVYSIMKSEERHEEADL